MTNSTKRTLTPRPQVPVAPAAITDEDASSYPAVGLTGRQLRVWMDALAVPFARRGRRRHYVVADVVAAISSAAERGEVQPLAESETHLSADEILAKVGLQRRSA